MGIWSYGKFLMRIAIIVVVLFVGVFFMHTFVPHEHEEQELFGSGLVLPVHSATGEKFFTIILLTSLLVVFLLPPYLGNSFLSRLLRSFAARQRQRPFRIFLHLFSRGILHTKAY